MSLLLNTSAQTSSHKSSRQLRDAGLIDLFDLVEADVSDEALDDFGDKEYVLYRLQSELGVQFNTHKQTILKTLYAFVAHHRALAQLIEVLLCHIPNSRLSS